MLWFRTKRERAERLLKNNAGKLHKFQVEVPHGDPQDSFNRSVYTAILLINKGGVELIASKVSSYHDGSREVSGYSPSREIFDLYLTHTAQRTA